MFLTDTHCHLFFDAFDADREAVIRRARQDGVRVMLSLGVDVPSSQATVALAEAREGIYAAVGVHPNDAAKAWEGERTLEALRSLAASPKVVAIGEIGLDYYRDRTPRLTQWHVLRQQLDLAAELGLPVSLHNREATADFLGILREWVADLRDEGNPLAERPGVWHAFGGSEAEGRAALEMGFLLGIGGPVTFKNAPDRRAVVASLPLEGLLLETDAPFLAPHPYRGRRNEPAYVRLVAAQVAELHGVSIAEAAEATSRNAQKLFRWRETV